LRVPGTRQELAPDVLLLGTLDFRDGRDLPLDGSRKEGREQLPLLVPREQSMVTASFAHRLYLYWLLGASVPKMRR